MNLSFLSLYPEEDEPVRPDQVRLSLSLRISHPRTLSISDPFPREPLRVTATVVQSSSPFPSLPVTILTKYSCLDTTPNEDAFHTRAMRSPRLLVSNISCLVPELTLRPLGQAFSSKRPGGHPDLLVRGESQGFNFLTIPPIGQGHAEVSFELTPTRLVKNIGFKSETVEEKLRRWLRLGDIYAIRPCDLSIAWWTFGEFEGPEGLSTKMISRWTLPDHISLMRGPHDDEQPEVAPMLRDLVDLDCFEDLAPRGAFNGEHKPDVAEMRRQGWVFGEPEEALKMTAMYQDNPPTFTIVE